MTDTKAMEAAARALAETNVFTACPGWDEIRFAEDREAYHRMFQRALTAYHAALGEPRGLMMALRRAEAALTALRAELDEARARAEVMAEALQKHHDWHLAQGEVSAPDDAGGHITWDAAEAYSESALCDKTVAALSPTAGQGVMNAGKQLRQDIGILLSALDRLSEATGESLDPEDNAMIDQIRLGERG